MCPDVGVAAVTMETVSVVPDGDGISRSRPNIPAAVQSGWILEGPSGAGDYTAGCPKELCHITAGWGGRVGLLV